MIHAAFPTERRTGGVDRVGGGRPHTTLDGGADGSGTVGKRSARGTGRGEWNEAIAETITVRRGPHTRRATPDIHARPAASVDRDGAAVWVAVHGDQSVGTVAVAKEARDVAAIRCSYADGPDRLRDTILAKLLFRAVRFCREEGYLKVVLPAPDATAAVERVFHALAFNHGRTRRKPRRGGPRVLLGPLPVVLGARRVIRPSAARPEGSPGFPEGRIGIRRRGPTAGALARSRTNHASGLNER